MGWHTAGHNTGNAVLPLLTLLVVCVLVWSMHIDLPALSHQSPAWRACEWATHWLSWRGVRLALLGDVSGILPAKRTAKPIGTEAHAQCTVCFHDDGGAEVIMTLCRSPVVTLIVALLLLLLLRLDCVQAVYEEADDRYYSSVGSGVCVGSTFRVVACNCAATCEFADQMCPFCACKCKACGGSTQRKPISLTAVQYDDGDDSDSDDGDAEDNEGLLTRWRARARRHAPLLFIALAHVIASSLLTAPHVVALFVPCVSVLLLSL